MKSNRAAANASRSGSCWNVLFALFHLHAKVLPRFVDQVMFVHDFAGSLPRRMRRVRCPRAVMQGRQRDRIRPNVRSSMRGEHLTIWLSINPVPRPVQVLFYLSPLSRNFVTVFLTRCRFMLIFHGEFGVWNISPHIEARRICATSCVTRFFALLFVCCRRWGRR